MKPSSPTAVARSEPTTSLEQRSASRPALAQRLQEILDLLDDARAAGCSADEAEERVRGPIRELGREVLQQRAEEPHARVQQQRPHLQPRAVHEGKQVLIWHTTYGAIRVEETL